MSQDKSKTPETGKGSPRGWRYFVSKNPGLVIEVTPQRYPDKDGNVAPYLRIPFSSEGKSEMHAGEGYLGSRNKLGTDTNANRHYGVYKIMDPGPAPFKDDGDDVEEDERQTAEEKVQARKIIDHIRKIYMYTHTPQDNQYRVTARLVELNWDPSEIRVYVNSMVIPGMGKPMARPTLGAPVESEVVAVAAKSAQMGAVPLRRRVVPS